MSASPVTRVGVASRDLSRQPWHRWFARLFIDYFLAVLGLAVVLALVVPGSSLLSNDYVLLWLAALAWVPIEAFCMAELGATPGKYLIGMRVTKPDGSMLSWRQAIARSVSAWANGCALMLPLVSLLTLNRQYNRLRGGQPATWDEQGGLRVTHLPMTLGRGILLGLMVLLILGVRLLASAAHQG